MVGGADGGLLFADERGGYGCGGDGQAIDAGVLKGGVKLADELIAFFEGLQIGNG